ncbi:MAG: tetratricopeptide repeat protein [Pirellulaceae bacterium]
MRRRNTPPFRVRLIVGLITLTCLAVVSSANKCALAQEANRPTDAQKIARIKNAARLTQLTTQLDQLIGAGKYEQARVVATEALPMQIDSFGIAHQDTFTMIHQLASIEQYFHDFDAVIKLRIDVLEKHIAANGEDHWQTTDARLALEHAKMLSKYTLEQQTSVDTAVANVNQALESWKLGNRSDAIKQMENALQDQRQLLPQGYHELAATLSNLGVLYRSIGEYEKAKTVYAEAITIRKQSLGETHPLLATTHNNLAGVLVATGKLEEAEKLYLGSLEIYKSAYGARSADYATGLNNLADLHRTMQKYDSAESGLREALAIRQELFGKDSAVCSSTLTNLANLYMATKDFAKAESIAMEAVEVGRKSLGEKHPEFATSLNNLAEVYSRTNRLDKAEELHNQTATIRASILGKEHPEYGMTLTNLAVVKFRLGKLDDAVELLTQAQAVFAKSLGEKHPLYRSATNDLEFIRGKMKEKASESEQPIDAETVPLNQ